MIYDLHEGFQPYVGLCQSYVAGEVSSKDFRNLYQGQTQEEPPGRVCNPTLDFIEILFFATENYCEDAPYFDPREDITAAQLREETIAVLREAGYDPFVAMPPRAVPAPKSRRGGTQPIS